MKEDLGLNPAQLEAVTAPLGPVLILAGAGSGKTRALTMRVVYLIKKLGIRPEQILAVTFTNKAAGEMKERIIRLIGKSENRKPDIRHPTSNLPTLGTFHSLGVRMLRENTQVLGYSSNFSIYDDDDQENVIKEILISERIDPTKFKPSMFAKIIDRAKNNLQEPKDLDVGDKTFNKTAALIYKEYQKRLKQNNAFDFGDLIMLPVVMFQTHPKILEKYQNRWQYLLIDEYQDTNYAQYMMAKLLANKHRNIFAVGDDAQAIYAFRGANLQNILDFEQDYPEAKIVRLEQNYRSTKPILAVAEKIIELSPEQHKKRLWTQNLGGELPVLYKAEDEMAEAWWVTKKILEQQDGSLEELQYEYEDSSILSRVMRRSQKRILPKLKNRNGLNNIAILYRTHAQSRALEELLIEAGIPYQIVGGLKFYERREIKDILAYLRLLLNPQDLISLKRVVNVPPRGVGPKTFDRLKQAMLTKNNQELESLLNERASLKNFFDIFTSINKLTDEANVLDVLKQIIQLSGYEKYLRDGSTEGEDRFENIQELFNVAGSFVKFPWKEGLEKFLEEVALMTNTDDLDLTSFKVTLMTLHQAKGLEFGTVFLVGLEEGILPHSRSLLKPKDIAEEIRLAYVGVTRARKRLFLVYCVSRKTYGQHNLSVPSRILKAIPEDLLDIHDSY